MMGFINIFIAAINILFDAAIKTILSVFHQYVKNKRSTLLVGLSAHIKRRLDYLF